ncbi:MaoC/PaaZ C-terminal domain-containing protein [Nocardia sp. NPDC003482]
MTATLEPGLRLPTRTYRIDRGDLVRYAGASGDFNSIHWSDRVAAAKGLPGVIAHGMLLMALAGRALADWTGAEFDCYDLRFSRPAVVPDDRDGLMIEIRGRVVEHDGVSARIVATVHDATGATLARASVATRIG